MQLRFVDQHGGGAPVTTDDIAARARVMGSCVTLSKRHVAQAAGTTRVAFALAGNGADNAVLETPDVITVTHIRP